MAKIILFLIAVTVSSFTYGQNIQDSQILIQRSIDLDVFQKYYHADELESRIPLIIMLNKIIPNELTLTKFELPVKFMSKEEIFVNNVRAFIEFEELEIDNQTGRVSFIYSVEGINAVIDFEKTGNNWNIISSNLTEKK